MKYLGAQCLYGYGLSKDPMRCDKLYCQESRLLQKTLTIYHEWIKKVKGKRIIKNRSWIFAYMMFSETTAAPHWTMIVSKCSGKLTVNKWTSGGKWTSMKYKANAEDWPQKPLSKKCEIYLGLMEICIR